MEIRVVSDIDLVVNEIEFWAWKRAAAGGGKKAEICQACRLVCRFELPSDVSLPFPPISDFLIPFQGIHMAP